VQRVTFRYVHRTPHGAVKTRVEEAIRIVKCGFFAKLILTLSLSISLQRIPD
jgi:hypothetical protein